MIFDLQHFSLQDGEGIRTTVFLKGCNLHCFWCHNPESQSPLPELAFYPDRCIRCSACLQVCPAKKDGRLALHTQECTRCGGCAEECYAGALQLMGKEMSVEDIIKDILQDKDMYLSSGGGVTFSGGEPFMQPELLRQLLQACRQNGISTAVESALCIPYQVLEPLLPLIDRIICDIKTADCDAHRRATGQPNTLILQNIRRLACDGNSLLIRTPVIPGFNDAPEAIAAIASFVASLPGQHRYELLPFRNLCKGKYTALGRRFAASDYQTPSAETMDTLLATAAGCGIRCRINAAFI